MSDDEKKGAGFHISVSMLGTLTVLVPAFWFLAKPILVSSISTAMAANVQAQIKQEVAPLNIAFTAIIRKEVTRLKKEIASMEWRRDNPPDDDWTEEDATNLVDRKEELVGQEAALDALTGNTT